MDDIEKAYAETKEELRKWVADCKDNVEKAECDSALLRRMIADAQRDRRQALCTYNKKVKYLADYYLDELKAYYDAIYDYRQALETYVKRYGSLPDEDDEDESND